MSEYKRLTAITAKGLKLKKGKKYVELLSDKSLTLNALNHLADIEDKIDNGKLKESPCKVGDTIYFDTYIHGKSIGVQPHKVTRVQFVVSIETTFGSIGAEIPEYEFGKSIFLTREQAEARLKEFQEGKK